MNWLELAKEKETALIQDLKGLIQIPSLLDEEHKTINQPFGPKIKEALDYVLNMAKRDGFETMNIDGYAGVIAYGEGDEIVGVLGHLDIVPIGEGWDFDPFGGEIKDGFMIGRGTMDDKGPTVAAYYALKLLKEQNVKLNKKIYLILGCDEETGMRCMEYYKQHAPIPNLGFVPDADFPVIYGEKGITNIAIDGSFDSCLIELVAGERPNIVIGQAKAVVKGNAKPELFDFYLNSNQLTGSYEYSENQTIYHMNGVFAHGAMPMNGVNAAMHLINFIGVAYQDNLCSFLSSSFMDYRGRALNIQFEGAHMGQLTMNVGMVRIENKSVKLVLDIRYPNDTNIETIITNIQKTMDQKQLKATILHDSKPLFNDPNSALIKTLEQSYRKYTNDYFTPLKTMGGGTYARAFDNFSAFGPELPNDRVPSFVGGVHQKNEAIRIEQLMKAVAIYADAMYELSK